MAVLRLELSLKNNQMTVFQSDRRFKIVVAGRRWGKTFLAVWSLIVNAFSGCDRIGYYIAPTYGQAKRVAWDVLLRLIPPGARVRVLQDELRIVLCNGSVIQLHGADRADSLRGVGLDYVVVDELAYMDGSTWPRVIRPLLSDRQGRALLISTPDGLNHFYDFYTDARADPDWAVFHYTTSDGG
jgi:phage terminase large subunit-like protein